MLVCRSSKLTSGRNGAFWVSSSLLIASLASSLWGFVWGTFAMEDCRERGVFLIPSEVDRVERAAPSVWFDLAKKSN